MTSASRTSRELQLPEAADQTVTHGHNTDRRDAKRRRERAGVIAAQGDPARQQLARAGGSRIGI
jgi:hypothetical protein